ncbi:MAG: DUF1801 domain-containing protein [Alphaproteobacteria bacterium]
MKRQTSGAKEGKAARASEESPSQLIDAKVAALGGWRGETFARVRKLIKEADPGIIEEVKWRKPSNPLGVPVWERDGIVCTGETYKEKVKLTFAAGAKIEDPKGLFNSSLDGNLRRAIDFHDGDKINEKPFKALIKAAVDFNQMKSKKKPPASDRAKARKSKKA